MTHGGLAYELPTLGRRTAGRGSSSSRAGKNLPTPTGDDANNTTRKSGEYLSLARSTHELSLLPTPSAYESTPTPEYVEELRANMKDPHERLYMPGRKWHAQRTLSRMAPTLLPTPVANPSNPGSGGELRAALTHGPGRRNETGTDTLGRPNAGRPSKLLPTPTAGDGKSSGSRNLPGSKAHAGVSLTDAIKTGDSTTPRKSSGASTTKPSDDGKDSPVPPPGQLTIEDA
jgi:hypothetical protein